MERYFYGLAVAVALLLVAFGVIAGGRLISLDTREAASRNQGQLALSSLFRTAELLNHLGDTATGQKNGAVMAALRTQLDILSSEFKGNEVQSYDLRQLGLIVSELSRLERSPDSGASARETSPFKSAAANILADLEAQQTALLHLQSSDIASDKQQTMSVVIIIGLLAAVLTLLAVRIICVQARSRNQMQTSLQESEARYRLITEYALDVIFQLKTDLTREYVSPASLRIMGYSPEELIGKKAAADLHPDDLPGIVEVQKSLLAGSNGESLTARTRHRDGRWIWIEARLSPIRNEQGRITKIIGVMSDVTARRNAEIALQNSEAKYRALYNRAPVMMYSLNPKSRIMTVTDEMTRIFGYSRDELIGRPSADFMTPEARGAIARITRPDFIANGFVHDSPAQFVTKAGAVRDVLLSAIAERDSDGMIVSAVVAIVDITERLLMERALRESETKYRLVADNASDLIFRLDPRGRRTYASPSFSRILGLGPDDLANQPIARFIIPEDRTRLVAAFRNMMRTGTGGRLMGRARHRDGRVLWLETNCTVVCDPDTGAAAEMIGFARDVTERQNAIEEAEQARRGAELANRAKSEFLATMSHEIRTPMNGVLGFAGILLETELTEEQQHLVSLVRSSGDALLAIINDILDLSKIEAGSLDLETIGLSLRDTIDSSLDVVRPSSVEKSLDLHCLIAPDVPDIVIGDPIRLRQILLNLLSNAIKFTRKGSVILKIGHASQDDRRLLFEVIDTGIGIPEDRMHLLFQAFSQADSSTTRNFGGTGLGLAISRRLVEAMPGGVIGVESAPGLGSRFWFKLDLPRADTIEAFEKPRAAPDRARPANVLVAEDVAINQMVVEGMLAQAGHNVELVNDGAAAVAAVATGVFDVVLMDMHMPVMDGLDATRAIRALPGSARNIPIIALSASAMRWEIELCQAAGMNGHLAKPIQQEDLLESVALWSRVSQRRGLHDPT